MFAAAIAFVAFVSISFLAKCSMVNLDELSQSQS